MDHVGPEDSHTFFYFALSAYESLHLQPINRPVEVLQEDIRVYSYSLPFHEPQKNPKTSIEELKKHPEVILPFIDEVEDSIHSIVNQSNKSKFALGGLSRGGFIASLLAARLPEAAALLTFAPLTKIGNISLFDYVENLVKIPTRVYIGDRDTMVGTSESLMLCKQTGANLTVSESIGHKGHGTPPHIFEKGAAWIGEILNGH